MTLRRSAYRLQPYFSPRLWGTRDLRAWYPDRGVETEPIGEAWLTADRCALVERGAEEPASLAHLVREHGEYLFGTAARPDHFPLLVKFLFPQDRLSVQVHPDDAYAAARGLGRGKTEMWYVVAAEAGGQLGVDLAAGVSLDEFATACRAGHGAELLNWFEVHPGDTIFLPAGALHAVGGGLVLCEVQQQSDNTFRLDDYGRRDAQGCLRELHLEDGLACARPGLGSKLETGLVAGQSGLLVECPHFRVERVIVGAGQRHRFHPGTAQVVTNIGAACELETAAGVTPKEALPLPRAQAALLPADGPAWDVTGPAELIVATLPGV